MLGFGRKYEGTSSHNESVMGTNIAAKYSAPIGRKTRPFKLYLGSRLDLVPYQTLKSY